MSADGFRCLICEGGEPRVMFERADLTLCRCRSCGLVQVAAPPDAETSEEGYRDAVDFSDALLAKEDEVVRRDVAVMKELCAGAPAGPVLDVGAGAGLLLRAALGQGRTAVGLELARESAARIRAAMDAEVHEVSIERAPLEPGTFGLVTFSHSLEHVADPVGSLRRACELLRPGGLLHVAVPNWSSGRRVVAGMRTPWIYPGHLTYFTRGTLDQALRRAGFRATRWETCPFLGVDYRYVITLLRRVGLERPVRRFLQMGDRSLDDLLTDDVQLQCPLWRTRTVLSMTRFLLAIWPEWLLCRLGWGEELRVTAVRREPGPVAGSA